MKFGSPLAQPAQQFTPGQADSLGTFAGSGGVSTIQQTVFGNNAYTALCFICIGTTRKLYCVSVQAADESTTPRVWVAASQTITFAGLFYQQCIVPVQSSPGESLNFTAYFNGNASDGLVVYGLTGNVDLLTRADGRAYPIGVFAASTLLNNGTSGTLLSALTSPLRYLIKSISMSAGGAANTPSVNAIVSSGLAVPLLQTIGAFAAYPIIESDSGILCDQASAITVTAGAASTIGAYIIYDVVV